MVAFLEPAAPAADRRRARDASSRWCASRTTTRPSSCTARSGRKAMLALARRAGCATSPTPARGRSPPSPPPTRRACSRRSTGWWRPGTWPTRAASCGRSSRPSAGAIPRVARRGLARAVQGRAGDRPATAASSTRRARLERGPRTIAVAVLSDGNPDQPYGEETIQGVAARLLAPPPVRGPLPPQPPASPAELVPVRRLPKGRRPPSPPPLQSLAGPALAVVSRKHYYPLHGHRNRAPPGPHRPPQALHLHRGARPAARVDRQLRHQGAGAARRALGGGDLRRLGLPAHGRAGLPRPLLPRGVRRPGRRLLRQPDPRRGDAQVQLGRAGDGHRRAHRHGHAAGAPVRHRGAEAELPGALDQGREDLLPGDHRARRRLRRERDQDPRRARRRRVGDQRLEDLHHQRPPRRLHRAGHQDRPRRGLRRLHAVPGRHGPARA